MTAGDWVEDVVWKSEHRIQRFVLNAWQGDPSTGTICRYPIKNILRISASQTPGDQK